MVACCQALGRFARIEGWKDPKTRSEAVSTLVSLVAMENTPSRLKVAALDALGRFKGSVNPRDIVPILKKETNQDVESAGVLAMARLGALDQGHRYFSTRTDMTAEDCYRYACIFAAAAHLEGAFEWLLKAMALGFTAQERVIEEPDFAPLIGDQRLSHLLSLVVS